MQSPYEDAWRRLLEIAARVRADSRATPSARSFAESVLDAYPFDAPHTVAHEERQHARYAQAAARSAASERPEA
ncbi:hypothetical protein [Schlegelella aquatica]|uniref:hypothetical protein n=1 Tax=Caldimonas aquatica TaxID=376175 RepID=UPI0037502DCF